MTTLTMGNFPQISQNNVVTYGGLSILVHLILLGALSLLHHTPTIQKPVPLVQVTLIDTPALSSTEPPSDAATPSEPAPSPLKSQRTVAPIQRSSLPVPQPMPPLVAMTTRIVPVLPPPVKKSVSPIARQVLQDTRAINALTMKDLLKVAPISNPSVSSQHEAPTLDMPFSPLQAWTHSLPAIHSQPSSQSRKTPSPHKRAMLMAHPPGMGKIGRTKVGIVHTPPLVYPRIAKKEGLEGLVHLRVTVHPDGSPGDIFIRKSSGHTVLDISAIKLVKSWRFRPARDGNIPIKSIVDIPIHYDLKENG